MYNLLGYATKNPTWKLVGFFVTIILQSLQRFQPLSCKTSLVHGDVFIYTSGQ